MVMCLGLKERRATGSTRNNKSKMSLGYSGEKERHRGSWDYISSSDVENQINALSSIKKIPHRFRVCFPSLAMDTSYKICVLTFPLSKGSWCSSDWESWNTSDLSTFPNKIICTLASVPAPLWSPVYTLMVYSVRLLALLPSSCELLSMSFFC